MNVAALPKLTSIGIELDLSENAFGELRRSDDIVDDIEALRTRMRADGYLFLPGLLDVEQVCAARRFVVDRLAEGDCIDESHPRLEAISKSGSRYFDHGLVTRDNRPLHALLYEGAMLEFYERFLGGPVRHYDYTWFR